MTKNITILDAEEVHFDKIHSIYAYSVINETASWEYAPPEKPELVSRFRSIKAANYPYLVAIDKGEIVGFAYANLFRGREGWRFVCENSVYVAKSARGKGVAKALMGEIIKKCKAQGLRHIIAVIGDSENKASISLHASLGFKAIGTLQKVGVKFSKTLDSVMMQLDL